MEKAAQKPQSLGFGLPQRETSKKKDSTEAQAWVGDADMVLCVEALAGPLGPRAYALGGGVLVGL